MTVRLGNTGETSSNIKEIRELAKNAATGNQTVKTDAEKDLSIGEANQLFALMSKDGVITQDEIDTVNLELKALNTSIKVTSDIKNPNTFNFQITEAHTAGNKTVTRTNSSTIKAEDDKAKVADCSETTGQCNKKSYPDGKKFNEIPFEDKMWRVLNGPGVDGKDDAMGRWDNSIQIGDNGPEINIGENEKANLVALKSLAGETLTTEETTLLASATGKASLSAMKKVPEDKRSELLSSLKEEVKFANDFNKLPVGKRDISYKNMMIRDFSFNGALSYKTEDDFAESMLRGATKDTISKCPGKNNEEKETAYLEMCKVVYRVAKTGTPKPLSDTEKKTLVDSQKNLNTLNTTLKNQITTLNDLCKSPTKNKTQIDKLKTEIETTKASITNTQKDISGLLKLEGNTIKMVQACIYYVNPEIAKASNQNTHMSTTEKVTLPGTNIKVPAGDGAHGRSTQLTTRMLMSEKSLPSQVNFTKTEDKQKLKDFIPDNTNVEILMDFSGSMEDNVAETNASVADAKKSHPTSTINTTTYTYNSKTGGSNESAIIATRERIKAKFPNPPAENDKSREVIVMTDANQEYDSDELQKLIDESAKSKVKVTFINPNTGTRLTLDQIKMKVCDDTGKVNLAKLALYKDGSYLNYNKMMPGFGTEGQNKAI